MAIQSTLTTLRDKGFMRKGGNDGGQTLADILCISELLEDFGGP